MDDADLSGDAPRKSLQERVEELLDLYESRKIFHEQIQEGNIDIREWVNSTEMLLHKLVVTVARIAIEPEP